MSLTSILLVGILLLLGVGFYGLLTNRHLVMLIVSLQVIAKAAILALVAAGHATGQLGLAQSMALTVIVVDTIVTVIALALSVQIKRRTGTLDTAELSRLRH